MWQGNYYIGDKTNPHHLSVGGVVVNNEGKICCYHFSGVEAGDVYTLMRATLKPNDASLESAIALGLAKEFGLEAKVEAYLGSIVSKFTNWEGVEIEKTTIYFLCKEPKVVDEHPQRDSLEMQPSAVEWHDPQFLLSRMIEQATKMNRTDLDEAVILERALKHL